MSVNSATFLELFTSHATPLAGDQLANRHREELTRASRRKLVAMTHGMSPLAPPYQIYPARASLYPDEHAA